MTPHRELLVKTQIRRWFGPAIRFLNRYSFPRKFAITGALVVVPLLFVTWQYATSVNERVELARHELSGNQVLRSLIPLWRVMREVRLGTVMATVENDSRASAIVTIRAHCQQLLDDAKAADNAGLLSQSSRWYTLERKLRVMLATETGDRSSLWAPEILEEMIGDLHVVFGQVADMSRLSVDPNLESQHLALSVTRLIPNLIELEDRLRQSLVTMTVGPPLDLKLAESAGGLNVLMDRVEQHLTLCMARSPETAARLRGSLSVSQSSVRRIEAAIRLRLVGDVEAPSLGEIDSLAAAAVRESLALLETTQDVLDEVVEIRTEQAQVWRACLLAAVIAPLALAAYLVIGLCLAIMQSADQMRDLTECILADQGCEPIQLRVEAEDELGRMIEHFGRLAVRLRAELTLAHAEALRASEAEESLRVNQERFNLVLQGANDGIWDWDLQSDRVLYSDRFKELLGYDKCEFDVWLSALADVLHPDDFDMTWRAIERHFQDREPYHIEHRLKTKSGEYRWFLERGQAVWDENGVPIRMAGSIKDVTARKASEARDQVRNRVLELLAAGASLNEILEPLVRSVESENASVLCSVLFLDKTGKRLLTGAAPSLPAFYNRAIDGLEIGVGVGSCGTAAYLGQRVICEDVSQHPYWEKFRDLAAQAGIAAAWSEPIRGMSGTVLGTFAVYRTAPGSPPESEIQLIEVAANLAGIAIERKQVDAALRESEERWKFALEGAGDGVWDWNIQTGEMVFSRRWTEMLGYDEKQIEASVEGWKGRIHLADLPTVTQRLQDYLDGKSLSYTSEHRMVCQDGTIKWILSRGIIVSCDATGAALRMIGTNSDITDRKQMEEDSRRYLQQVEASRDRITEQSVQLIRQSEELARARDLAEAAARAKSDFLANMSHELRTPLTAILGYADLLYDEESGDDVNRKHRETVDIIRSNGRHLQELIDDILDLSKIEADRMVLEWSQVSPRQLVDDVLRLMQLRAREKELNLQAEYCYPLPERVTTDPLRFRQILVNLVGNAIKFTQRGSIRVTLRYEASESRQIITVEDTGIGIEADQLQRLFTPFSQADASMSRRFGGTGLGLSISKRLAQMLGGDIVATSVYGSGSTFTLEIRAEVCLNARMLTSESDMGSETAASPRAVAAPLPPLSGRILLAEDVPANQKLIAFLLNKWGAEVQVVDNGVLAVAAALKSRHDQTPFDLILMDIQMPEMDGYTATATLREKGYEGKIIALTAHASDDDRDRCLHSGFDGFAVKPIQKEQLHRVCHEMLATVAADAANHLAAPAAGAATS